MVELEKGGYPDDEISREVAEEFRIIEEKPQECFDSLPLELKQDPEEWAKELGEMARALEEGLEEI